MIAPTHNSANVASKSIPRYISISKVIGNALTIRMQMENMTLAVKIMLAKLISFFMTDSPLVYIIYCGIEILYLYLTIIIYAY